jgi:Cu-Zn family superoxide dismutase
MGTPRIRQVRRTGRGRLSVAGVVGVIALALLAVSPGSVAGQTVGSESSGSVATANLADANGTVVARVVIAQVGNSAAVAVRATGLTTGFHGFHIHTVGQCVAPFTTAGGHFNPGGANHDDHAGDMPVLLVQSGGTATAAFQTDRFTVDALFDADGSAVIIHADADNYANIPTRYSAGGVPGPDAATLATGDSGARIACGVLTR